MTITIGTIKDEIMIFRRDTQVREVFDIKDYSKYLDGHIEGSPFKLYLTNRQLILRIPGTDPFMTTLPFSENMCVEWISNMIRNQKDENEYGYEEEEFDENDENDYLHTDPKYEDIDNEHYNRW